MSAELNQHEVDLVRSLLRGLGLGSPHTYLNEALSLGQQILGVATAVRLGPERQRMLQCLLEGMNPGYTTMSDQAAVELGSVLAQMRGLGYHIPALQQIAMQAQPGMDEIGAMKNTISQLVDQMNSFIETVQRAINELRDEREILALSRTLESDQDYGALS